MFVVLQTTKIKKPGIFKRIFVRRPPETVLHRIDVGNTYYYILEASSYTGEPNWETVYEAAGRGAGFMLIPENLSPPPDSSIKQYDTSKYKLLLYFNVFCSVIKKCRPAELDLAVLDKEGLLSKESFELLKRAKTVAVITSRPDRYEKVNDTARDLLGAELIITEDTSVVSGCTAVFAPFGIRGFGILPLHSSLFSPTTDGYNFSPEDITLPEPYESEIPEGINKIEFAAALYEKCGVKRLGSLTPLYLHTAYFKIPIDAASNKISVLT